MSRREIDANNAAKARYREQQIERILGDLRLLADDWSGKDAPMDVEAKRARLEDELRELEAMRAQTVAVLEAPTIEQKVEYLNDAVLSIYPEITGLRRAFGDWQAEYLRGTKARNEVVDRWIIALAALVFLAYGAIGAIFVYVR